MMSSHSKSYALKSSGSLTRIVTVPKLQKRTLKITSRLNLARKKLLPVINEILKTASENSSRLPYEMVKSYHLTIEQYKDAIWASEVLKEVNEILRFHKLRKHESFKPENFNFDTTNIKVNNNGKIYVDTPILVQLIDLHNMLGDILEYLRDMPAEGYRMLQEQSKNKTKSDAASSDSVQNKKTEKVEKVTKEILTTLTLPLNTNFLVMAANSVKKSKSKMPCLLEERSSSEINLTGTKTVGHVRQTKSTGSVLNTSQKSKVVDAMAARKIIVRCLADLDTVKQFLEEQSPGSEASGISLEDQINKLNARYPNGEEDENCICCDCPPDDAEPLNFVWKEDGENGSKLVICIKGKTEDEGDIHVVIRQCPECLQAKQSGRKLSQGFDGRRLSQGFDESLENFGKQPSRRFSLSKEYMPKGRGVFRDQCKCRSQDDAINVVFDPDEPAQSIVEGPQFKLFETVNLNLTNAEGQDLVISLCVKPKGNQNQHSGFNLDQIFSESRTEFKKNVAEKMIPLSRTKICSSMEFDVNLVMSKLRMTGVKHPNQEIADQLNDLGVYNILRASRPVKCGRRAVLNEHQKKFIPYSASLRSLPLDDEDLVTINQSLNMSLHKSKHSKIFPDSRNTKKEISRHYPIQEVYFFEIWQKEMIRFNNKGGIPKMRITRKLNFYIYLEADIQLHENSYEVWYFEVVVDKNKSSKNKQTTVKTVTTVEQTPIIDTTSDVIKEYVNSARNNCQKNKIPIHIKYHSLEKHLISKSSLNQTKNLNSTDKNPKKLIKNEVTNTNSNELIANDIDTSCEKIGDIEELKFLHSEKSISGVKNYQSIVRINSFFKKNIVDENLNKVEINSSNDNTSDDVNRIINSEIKSNDVKKTPDNDTLESNKSDQCNDSLASKCDEIINNKDLNVNDEVNVNCQGNLDNSRKCYGDSGSTQVINDSHHIIGDSGDKSRNRKMNSNGRHIEIIDNTLTKTTINDTAGKEQFDEGSGKYSGLEQVEETVKPAIVTIKEADKKSFFDNSIASNESIGASSKCPIYAKNTSKATERKKKSEFYTSRSNAQLLVGKKIEKKLKPIIFRVPSKKKPQQNLLEKQVQHKHFQKQLRLALSSSRKLALSSTLLKEDKCIERTLSKVILRNLSKFVYDVIVKDLTTDTKAEVLSKIDEFLGKYCDLQAASTKRKGRKSKYRSKSDTFMPSVAIVSLLPRRRLKYVCKV